MGLDIYFQEDVRNALLAANEASSATVEVIADCIRGRYEAGMVTAVMRAYCEGYNAALATIALAFGLSPAKLNLGEEHGQNAALHKRQRDATQAIIGGVHGQDAAGKGQSLREISNQPHRLEPE